MNHRTERAVIEKARLACGLSHILKDCTDDLRIYSNPRELDRLNTAVEDAKTILQKLTDVVVELEYVLYLEDVENEY